MSKKILIISGPTATGKTDLAIKLAKKFNGELVSADSRQVYKGMDIGTGKDHPRGIKIHLVDVIKPNQSFSVAQYQKLVFEKIKEIQSNGKLPIMVGGTGLYINSIINSQTETFSIKPKPFLRLFLNHFSVSGLQKIYKLLDCKAFNNLNNSEKHNPHRLIRKIEINLFVPKKMVTENQVLFNDYLHISLTAPSDYLYQKIDTRVKTRFDAGLLDEIRGLLNKYSWSDPGLNTLAYKEFKPYFDSNNSETLNDCVVRWKFDEHAYARRQKTWFKNKSDIMFFDITKPSYKQNILEAVDKWYNKS